MILTCWIISFPKQPKLWSNTNRRKIPEEKTPKAKLIRSRRKSIEVKTEQVKSEVAEQLSGVNLSAADIDAIAEKVVEKLTARMKE